MYVAIFIGVLAMLFAYLEDKGALKNGLKIAFVVITTYMAIRYDYGNDYLGYLEGFNTYKNYHGSIFDIDNLKLLHGHGDYGWVFLNLMFRPFGFFSLIIFLSILENLIIYDFIKTYVPKKWYAFAVFIYVFNPNILILGGSMMRQWLAICLFIFAFRYIRDRKPIKYALCIFVAMTIHSSAIILFPLYFITYLRNKNMSFTSLVWFIPLLVLWFIVSPTLFANNLEFLMAGENFEKYLVYSEASEETYGILGIIVAFLYPIVCITQTRRMESVQRLLIYIFFLSIFIRPLGLVVAMVARVGFYFVAFSVVVFPMVMDKIRSVRIEWMYALLVVIIIPTIRDFYAFFHSEIWVEHYMQYQTIFSVPWQ